MMDAMRPSFLLARLACATWLAITVASGASLTGRVTDGFGHTIAGTKVQLTAEAAPDASLNAVADADGIYRFTDVKPGSYTLRLLSRGFYGLRVKDLVISDAAQVVPDLALELGRIADCGGHGSRDFVRFLSAAGETGDLSGSVRNEKHPLENATVELLCGAKGVCAKAATDAMGAFVFRGLAQGSYTVRVTHAGYYPLAEPEYKVATGMESGYLPIFLKACADGNCDPRLRPKKIVICA